MSLFTEYFALDLGSSSLKALSLDRGAGGVGYAVADALHHPLPSGLVTGGFTNPIIRSVPDLTTECRRLLEQMSSHKEGCILGLPDRWVKLHLVDLVLKPHELSSSDYLSWKLRRTLSLPDGLDVVIDQQVLEAKPVEEGEGLACRIMAAAVRRDLLTTVSTILADLHVQLMAIDTSTLGVYNLLEEQHPENTLDRPLIICHIGHEATVAKVFHGGILTYERVIEVGGEEFTRLFADAGQSDPEQAQALKEQRKFFPQTAAEMLELLDSREIVRAVFSNWLRELSVTFRFYQDTFKVLRLPKIYLTGGSSLFAGLPEFLGDFFETACERFNPLAGIPTPQPIDGKVVTLGALFAPALGLLSREDGA